VFVDEQKVPEEMELDEFDKDAVHVVARKDNQANWYRQNGNRREQREGGQNGVQGDSRNKGIGKELMGLLERKHKKKLRGDLSSFSSTR
jgi:predicted GNAT family N-acyltransferase